MNNRDMYYGYGGFTPISSTNQIPMGSFSDNVPNNYTNNMFNDMNSRIERLERQVKRLDQRISRLEVPYSNNTINEIDNDKYIM
ncbi:MAG: hypothetical protein IJI49_02945 [Bacilli bacterium]|nr:hypothetical protein [Bacilli bacterium]